MWSLTPPTCVDTHVERSAENVWYVAFDPRSCSGTYIRPYVKYIMIYYINSVDRSGVECVCVREKNIATSTQELFIYVCISRPRALTASIKASSLEFVLSSLAFVSTILLNAPSSLVSCW